MDSLTKFLLVIIALILGDSGNDCGWAAIVMSYSIVVGLMLLTGEAVILNP